MIKVAVLGYGTIGSGVVEILENKKNYVTKQAGDEIQVKYVLDLRDFPGSPIEDILVHDFNIILQDPEVDIVVEVMGGVHPAYEFVKAALEAGKSAVTSNKALVAACGTELMHLAKEKGLNFQFEASVGGGIPIIRPLYSCLTAGEVKSITGILNGTTNFMLTKMHNEGRTYDDVLAEAQALGYAERNPSADVDGFDACRKIAILSSIAFGQFVDYEQIHTRGIREISDVDMAFADAMGCSIKLFGTACREGEAVYARVTPMLVQKSHPLYAVSDVFNAVLVDGDVTGQLMFYGSGAGKLPTASAVVADIVEIAKNPGRTVMPCWSAETLQLADASTLVSPFFVRVAATPDAEDLVKSMDFGAERMTTAPGVEGLAFVTKPMTPNEVNALMATYNAAVGTEAVQQCLPVA